jgi:hypothetical protein
VAKNVCFLKHIQYNPDSVNLFHMALRNVRIYVLGTVFPARDYTGPRRETTSITMMMMIIIIIIYNNI